VSRRYGRAATRRLCLAARGFERRSETASGSLGGSTMASGRRRTPPVRSQSPIERSTSMIAHMPHRLVLKSAGSRRRKRGQGHDKRASPTLQHLSLHLDLLSEIRRRAGRLRGRPGLAGLSLALRSRTPGATPRALANRRSVSSVMFTVPRSILRIYWTSSPVRASSCCCVNMEARSRRTFAATKARISDRESSGIRARYPARPCRNRVVG
jgi:hypothetical protein